MFQRHHAFQKPRMRILVVARQPGLGLFVRQLRQQRDAVERLLAVGDDVVAQRLDLEPGKGVIDAFGFLQAQHIRPHRLEEFGDEIDAQAHRIDVPCCQGKAHGDRHYNKTCD